ncbi:hypothetical protein M9H77_21969 [Catharanthus roseus]|uniref:Uncharacterized protein n=1 Tax=Catharanthus roseus TaxID=4058 RepID=A0ACC0APV8_CATRO|nr:hypothetical protein M9H77_21969 [Catharanthus roseus]
MESSAELAFREFRSSDSRSLIAKVYDNPYHGNNWIDVTNDPAMDRTVFFYSETAAALSEDPNHWGIRMEMNSDHERELGSLISNYRAFKAFFALSNEECKRTLDDSKKD